MSVTDISVPRGRRGWLRTTLSFQRSHMCLLTPKFVLIVPSDMKRMPVLRAHVRMLLCPIAFVDRHARGQCDHRIQPTEEIVGVLARIGIVSRASVLLALTVPDRSREEFCRVQCRLPVWLSIDFATHPLSTVVDWRDGRAEAADPDLFFDQTHYRLPIAQSLTVEIAAAIVRLRTQMTE